MSKTKVALKGAKEFRDDCYYHIAHQGSADVSHPAIKKLKSEIRGAKKVLDMGCGEGTRLNALVEKGQIGVGVDLSKVAIQMAKKQYKGIRFQVADLENLPFKNNSFDLCFSAFVFEHLENPEKVLKEALRVTKVGGKIVIIAPNFGSPNRRSPNSVEGKISKLINGFKRDTALLTVASIPKLGWKNVRPQMNRYEIDADTTVEPYLLTLVKFAKGLGLNVNFYSSFWRMDRLSLFQLAFRFLSLFRIYPYYYWGPHLCIIMEKI